MNTLSVVLVLVFTAFANGYIYTKYQKYIYGRSYCNFYCDSKVLVVCGNNGHTYINDCALKKAICKDKTGKLKKLYNGPCGFIYGRTLRGILFNPVCASDGGTYSNEVFVRIASCLTGKKRTVISQGVCGCKENCQLRKCDLGCNSGSPVCGTDGINYSSECALEKQSCLLNGRLKKLHNGICKASYKLIVGIEKFKPIRGNDGNLYSSKAYLELARCQNPNLRPESKDW